MKKEKNIRWFMALYFISAFSLFGQPTNEYEISALETSQPISVDGNLDEAQWQQAQKISRFTQREPNEGESATELTELCILYDDKNLYIGVICFDSHPDRIVANQMMRDGELMNDDYFEIFIDSYHDHRNAFYFVINPLGAKRDALIRDEGNSINWNWDGIWKVRTKRNERGWSAEPSAYPKMAERSL